MGKSNLLALVVATTLLGLAAGCSRGSGSGGTGGAAGPPPLSVAISSLPPGTAGASYNATLSATGGAAPYTWSIAGGSLPPGLSLDPATGAITGTPTAAGNYSFTVRVADASGATASQTLSITIASGGSRYDFTSLPPNTWVNIGAANSPSDNCGWTTWVWDAVHGKGLTFGIDGTSYSNDVWVYDISTNAWTRLRASDPPFQPTTFPDRPADGHPGYIGFDSANAKFVFYGVFGRAWGGPYDATFTFDHLQNVWAKPNPPAPLPGERIVSSLVYDPVVQAIVLFGGWSGSTQNDVWFYSVSSNRWTQMLPSDPANPTLPAARWLHAAEYDSKRKRVVIFAGESDWAASVLNDLWAYDATTNAFQKIVASNPPPRRVHGCLSYDSLKDRLLLFGGMPDSSGTFPDLGDTWAFDFGTSAWTQLSPSAVPTGRGNTTMDTLVYDPARNVHLLWTNDGVWAFRMQ